MEMTTRCECEREGHSHCDQKEYHRCACTNDAVRMVTVPFKYEGSDHREKVAVDFVPMCQPCADWHEIHGRV